MKFITDTTVAAICVILILTQPMELQGAPQPWSHEETAKSEQLTQEDLPSKSHSEVQGMRFNAKVSPRPSTQMAAYHTTIQQEGISIEGCGPLSENVESIIRLLSGIPTSLYGIDIRCNDPCTTIVGAIPANVVTLDFDVCDRGQLISFLQ